LIAIAEKLERSAPLEWGDRVLLLSLLFPPIEEASPVDPRVKVRLWQTAMLAAALVDKKGVTVKAAVSAAIAFYDCPKSARFHQSVTKACSEFRAGRAPRNLPLLPAVPGELVELAANRL